MFFCGATPLIVNWFSGLTSLTLVFQMYLSAKYVLSRQFYTRLIFLSCMVTSYMVYVCCYRMHGPPLFPKKPPLVKVDEHILVLKGRKNHHYITSDKHQRYLCLQLEKRCIRSCKFWFVNWCFSR